VSSDGNLANASFLNPGEKNVKEDGPKKKKMGVLASFPPPEKRKKRGRGQEVDGKSSDEREAFRSRHRKRKGKTPFPTVGEGGKEGERLAAPRGRGEEKERAGGQGVVNEPIRDLSTLERKKKSYGILGEEKRE